MMLTTSDIHAMVTQGIRTRYGRLVDPEVTFNTWLEQHDEQVIDTAFAFTPAPPPITASELVGPGFSITPAGIEMTAEFAASVGIKITHGALAGGGTREV